MKTARLPCACTTLRKASRAVTRFYDEALRPTGLTSNQLAVMRAVDREGQVPMSRIAETLVMDRTSLYRAVGPLLRYGDLESVSPDDDSRAKYLKLTHTGERRMARAAPYWERAQRQMLRRIGPERWREMSQWLLEAIQ
jgi:DNA-binding MarR family transcriptional regulator